MRLESVVLHDNLGITTRYLSGLVRFLEDLQEQGVTHTAGCPHYRVRYCVTLVVSDRISCPQYGITRWPLFGMFYCITSMELQSEPHVSGRISEVSAIGVKRGSIVYKYLTIKNNRLYSIWVYK